MIQNTERVFHIGTEGGNSYRPRDYFCHLAEIPKIIQQDKDEFRSGFVSFQEFWNGKWKMVSKKRMNEMFKANQIDFKL